MLQGLALWMLYWSLDAWASLSFAINSVFNPISPSVRKGESLEANPQPCSALELMSRTAVQPSGALFPPALAAATGFQTLTQGL